MIREQLLNVTPPWMQRRNFFRYLYTFALVADATLETALQGMAARLPGFGTPTALDRIGRDRVIRRGFAETDESFAERVTHWLDPDGGHPVRGNGPALLKAVQAFLGPKKPRCRLVVPHAGSRTTWITLDTDGTVTKEQITPENWTWDPYTAALQTRAWLVIYSTGAEAPWVTDGVWVEGATSELWEEETVNTWGSDATLSMIAGVKQVVKDWKAAESLYVEICVSFDDDLFDPADGIPPNPDEDWEFYSHNVAGEQVASRANGAVYWVGTG